jgi:hypothetical protein
MALDLCVAALKGIGVLTDFVRDAYSFYKEHKDAVSKLKALGVAVTDAKSAYVANRATCLGECQ